MDTIYEMWAVWYLTPANKLAGIEYLGTLQECVNFVQPRLYGCWAILPYDHAKE